MELSIPSMTRLFDQLGLSSEKLTIDAFIALHNPLPEAIMLADASFWNSSQAEFLLQGVDQDSAWAIVIERLNEALRKPR